MRISENIETIKRTKKITEYKCDVCGIMHKLSDYDLKYNNENPYISISHQTLDGYMNNAGIETYDFCSVECMIKYLARNSNSCLGVCGGNIKIPSRYKLKIDEWK